MDYRRLGKTGLEVSAIGFGGAAVSGEGRGYGFGAISESESIDLCLECFDRGINLVDTAPVYGFGLSEQRIGKALAGRRDDVVLVSKAGIAWDDEKRLAVDNRPQVVEDMLHGSLRNLGTDYIDVYLIHWPDPNVDIRMAMEVLARAKEMGKVLHVGLSNSYPDDIERALEVADVAVLQNELNLFKRQPVDTLFPIARDKDMGFMGWGTFDKGILTGRVTESRAFDSHDVRGRAPWWTDVDHTPKYQAMERIERLLEEAGHSGLELALAFVLQFDEVSTALCGVRNRRQLDSAVSALDHLPASDVLQTAENLAREHTDKG